MTIWLSDAEILLLKAAPVMKLPRVRKRDGSLHHIVCYGSREHVLSWTTNDKRCSEPECEVNRV